MKNCIKVLVLTVCILAMFSISAFAAPSENISVETVQKIADSWDAQKSIINNPKEFVTSLNGDDSIAISGVVKENDTIKISLYTRVDDQYVPMGEDISPKVDKLGVFFQNVSFKYQTTTMPKESKLSKDTFIILELRRGDAVVKDYRVVKITDKKDIQESLSTMKDGFNTYSTNTVKKS